MDGISGFFPALLSREKNKEKKFATQTKTTQLHVAAFHFARTSQPPAFTPVLEARGN
jgi:hypothetical protein